MANNRSEIYERGYEVWEGDRSPDLPPWYLIGMAGVKNVVASSGCLARAVFVVLAIIYYFVIVMSTVVRLPN